MIIIIYFILQRNMSSYYNRALSFLQQYYFTVDFINDNDNDFLSKAIPICYVACRIKPDNYFILSQKRTTEPYKNNFYKMINIYHFIHQMILWYTSFVHE